MNNVVLGIYPNLRGFAYACVEMPDKLLSYGVVVPRPYDAAKLLKRTRKLMGFYSPTAVVLRDANAVDSLRMRKLINEVTECAVENGMGVRQHSRERVRQVFGKFGASTKDEIANCIIEQWFPELEERRPRPRGAWEPEDYYMGVFDSLALIMANEFLSDG